jgi:hypothetical protein
MKPGTAGKCASRVCTLSDEWNARIKYQFLFLDTGTASGIWHSANEANLIDGQSGRCLIVHQYPKRKVVRCFEARQKWPSLRFPPGLESFWLFADEFSPKSTLYDVPTMKWPFSIASGICTAISAQSSFLHVQ